MWCKFPYNENFVVFPKKHAGGNRNLIINFAWPYHDFLSATIMHVHENAHKYSAQLWYR